MKRGIAPCGHPGTYVTNTFVTCDIRCEFGDATPDDESDGVTWYIDPETTKPLCPYCWSDDVEPYNGMFSGSGKVVYHCHGCQQGFES